MTNHRPTFWRRIHASCPECGDAELGVALELRPGALTVSRESVVDASAVCGSCGGIAEGEALAAELGGVLQDPGEHWHAGDEDCWSADPVECAQESRLWEWQRAERAAGSLMPAIFVTDYIGEMSGDELDVMEPYAGAGATMLMSIVALAVRERVLSRFAERDLRRLIACRIADMLSADALDGGPS